MVKFVSGWNVPGLERPADRINIADGIPGAIDRRCSTATWAWHTRTRPSSWPSAGIDAHASWSSLSAVESEPMLSARGRPRSRVSNGSAATISVSIGGAPRARPTWRLRLPVAGLHSGRCNSLWYRGWPIGGGAGANGAAEAHPPHRRPSRRRCPRPATSRLAFPLRALGWSLGGLDGGALRSSRPVLETRPGFAGNGWLGGAARPRHRTRLQSMPQCTRCSSQFWP